MALTIWRLYDFFSLHSEDVDGFRLFTKWVGIDTAVLYGLSSLRIPWLQWSSTTFTALFIFHGLLNWLLMFQIPIPIFTWLASLTRIIYDRELAISERRVKPASILQNSSLILGKQIVHILPEGLAILNPENEAFCISPSRPSVVLPIQINQTAPTRIELLRVDLDTNEEETLILSAKEIKKMKRVTDAQHNSRNTNRTQILLYNVRQLGLYRLQRVLDDSRLEVQQRQSEAVVVRCPNGQIKNAPRHRCMGALSDFLIEIEGTPPVTIRYSKIVNSEDQGHAVLHFHPEQQPSPFSSEHALERQLATTSSLDISWARTQTIEVPMNESLGAGGYWRYRLDEVSDGFGNVVNYSDFGMQDFSASKNPKAKIEQDFLVHERPRGAFYGCDMQHPIKVGKSKYKSLPIKVSSAGTSKLESGPYTLLYLFTPQYDLLPGEKHSESAQIKDVILNELDQGIEVRDPGLYTLQSIASEHCDGEILEPSSCVLFNPPEPDLSITAEPIPDRCAGNLVGLMVDLDLLGTPPFRIHYTVKGGSGQVTPKTIDVERLHDQLELRPLDTGHYKYEFSRISDAVYSSPRSLLHKSLLLEQDVKAPASVYVYNADSRRRACLDEATTIIIQLLGEPPFILEYELVHGAGREKFKQEGIEENAYYLTTPPLNDGGEYVLALTSITDMSGCKNALQAEIRVDVNLQRPKASFGSLDGTRFVNALEGRRVGLPLRLQGEGPWTIYYRRLEDPGKITTSKVFRSNNDMLEVDVDGTYEIVDVHDATCPGTVDSSSNQFTISWIPRPALSIKESPLITRIGNKFARKDVCQGDEAILDISFVGTPPFNYEYIERLKPVYGSQSVAQKRFSSGLNHTSIGVETSEAGLYEYTFTKMGDSSYNHDSRRFRPIVVQQRVHPKPSACFIDAGKIYKYCQEDTAGEPVPINLMGQPPFHLELEVKHQAVARSELISIPHIESSRYTFQVPHRLRALGTHSVVIRKVQDSYGCQRQTDRSSPHVFVSVAELPSLSPLEERRDYCVGDRIAFTLSGTPPFSVFYQFEGKERKASVPNTDFRRIAEKPGIFFITAISDQRSTDDCKARMELAKTIHEMPSVRISKGRTSTIDIHEGGEAEILFEFSGTPPFHFT